MKYFFCAEVGAIDGSIIGIDMDFDADKLTLEAIELARNRMRDLANEHYPKARFVKCIIRSITRLDE